jgi:hypothetical protein
VGVGGGGGGAGRGLGGGGNGWVVGRGCVWGWGGRWGRVVRWWGVGFPPCVTHSLLILFHSFVPPFLPCLCLCSAALWGAKPAPPLSPCGDDGDALRMATPPQPQPAAATSPLWPSSTPVLLPPTSQTREHSPASRLVLRPPGLPPCLSGMRPLQQISLSPDSAVPSTLHRLTATSNASV